MASDKNTLAFVFLARVEPTFGGAVTLDPALDAIHLADAFNFDNEPTFDGGRRSNVSPGPFRRAQPGAFFATGTPTVQMRGRGAGNAYSATDVPPDIHQLLRASGHTAGFSSSPSPQWLYLPTITTPASLAAEMYYVGEKQPLTKAYADFGFAFEAGGYGIASFPLRGVPGTIVDAALPTPTFYNSLIQPPKAENIGFSITPEGGATLSTLKIRSVSFARNQDFAARTDANSGGHQGFQHNGLNPVLEVEIEQPLQSTINFYSNFRQAVPNYIDFLVGSVQYARWRFTAPSATLMAEPEKGDANGIATMTLRFQCTSTTPGAIDHYWLLWN